MKRLYRIRASLDVVAYLDDKDADNETGKTVVPELLKQLAKEYGGGFFFEKYKITQVHGPKNLPEGWDIGCIPFGINTQRSINIILGDIKAGKED